MEVIGLSGFAQSGKDHIYSHCLKSRGWMQISYAWHFKADLIGKGVISFEEAFKTKPEKVRTMLQLVGTELGRNVYGQLVWCNIAHAWMKIYEEHWGMDRFVIPDVRFWNELHFIQHQLGGKVIRIKAPIRSGQSSLTTEQNRHPSEAEMVEMKNSDFDAVIYNDEGDMDLNIQMKSIFQEFGYEYNTV